MTRKGCTNRPFYHLNITSLTDNGSKNIMEQIGTYDPMPNRRNEKLVAINFDRLKYWLGRGAEPHEYVKHLLGLSGYMRIHPETTKLAAETRAAMLQRAQEMSQPMGDGTDTEETSEAPNG